MNDHKVETIRLELLRPGDPWGQVLSPLTHYIAICGDDPAETITIPFDQRSLMERVSRLNYEHGEPATPGALREAAELARRVLESVRGFRSMLTNAAREASLVHVRLVLTAAELAMIPFELAYAPLDMNGVPTITLNSSARVVITRETRHERLEDFEWPCCPKILFVVAAPDGTDVPETAHYTALRRALRPLLPEDAASEEESKYLLWLRRATLRDIERECEKHAPTHVHILAHGVVQQSGRRSDDGSNFGIFLESTLGSRGEIVSADRLALALRRGPKVVSLAVCDSGNGGLSSIIGTGASIAHRLHDGEIPFVVASQFPMTFAGSAIMTETLYTGLLRGTDPREVAWETRRKLFERVPDTHDWASFAVYADLPPSIEAHAEESVRIFERMSIDRQMLGIEWSGALPEAPVANDTQFVMGETAHARIAAVRKTADHLFEQARAAVAAREWTPARRQLGMLASVYKRLGVLYDRCAHAQNAALPKFEAPADRNVMRAQECYLQSLSAYQLIRATNEGAPWVVTQVAIMSTMVADRGGTAPLTNEERDQLTQFAVLHAKLALVHPQQNAHEQLDNIAQHIELELLSLHLKLQTEQWKLDNLWEQYIEVFTRPGFAKAQWHAHLHARNLRRIAFWFRDTAAIGAFVDKCVKELERRGVDMSRYTLGACESNRRKA